MEKRSVGHPLVYSRVIIEKWVKAFSGQPGGLQAATDALQEEDGHKGISKITVWKVAKELGISFGRGKPKVAPKAVMRKKTRKKAA